MSSRDFIAVCVRVAGIVLAIYVLRTGAPIAGVLGERQTFTDPEIIAATAQAMAAAAAFCMLAFPNIVARVLVSGATTGDARLSWSVEEMQSALLAVVGVWIVATAAIDLSPTGSRF